MKRIDVAIAIIRKGSQVLICQRKEGNSFGGYWEFPGGKLERDESPEQCVCREVTEELAIRIVARRQLPAVDHQYEYGLVRLHPFICDHLDGDPQLIEVQAAKWIDPADLPKYRFPEANDRLIEDVIRILQHRSDGEPG